MLRDLTAVADPNLLVGIRTSDDAGVYRLNDQLALVQTVDFFAPVVDDPFVYGQIAAANALSDVYAMGGEPKTALNIAAFPDDRLSLDILHKILEGGAERCREARCTIVGGHTVRDREVKFGMAVTGLIDPSCVVTNAAAQAGDVLMLTKPLGTGLITTAAKAKNCPVDVLSAACASMIALNRDAAAAALMAGAHAMTDVTGFGLAGHALEMALGSRVTLDIDLSALPLLPGLRAIVAAGYRTRAAKSNAAYVADRLGVDGAIDPFLSEVFYDPQTSGGLLVALPAAKAEIFKRFLEARGGMSVMIGRVRALEDVALRLRS